MAVDIGCSASRLVDLSIPTKPPMMSIPTLMERALLRKEGSLGAGGTLLVSTGKYTGRSPKNKYIVDEGNISDVIWRKANQPMPARCFDILWQDIRNYLSDRELFVQDLAAGADPSFQVNIRVMTEFAWHSLFIRHLLREGCRDVQPDYLIVDCPGFKADPKRHGCCTESVVAVNFNRRIVLIAGTGYAGEIKKSVFTLLNRILPEKGVVSMHCSANHAPGDASNSAIFFGLSGTGKTTLSSAAGRVLIGDDEHAWSDTGIFNIEGGCYAKTLNLEPSDEPEIYAVTQKFGTVVENMVFDHADRALNFADSSITENTRCAYPLESIPGASPCAATDFTTDICASIVSLSFWLHRQGCGN